MCYGLVDDCYNEVEDGCEYDSPYVVEDNYGEGSGAFEVLYELDNETACLKT